MSVHLIVGLPGAGKSTLQRELQSRDVNAVDADYAVGISGFRTSPQQTLIRTLSPEQQSLGTYRWCWDEQAIDDFIVASDSGDRYLLGNASNSRALYSRFANVFALSLPKPALRRHLQSRTESFGSTPQQRREILRWTKDYARTERQLGAIIIQADRPINEIADEIQMLSHAAADLLTK